MVRTTDGGVSWEAVPLINIPELDSGEFVVTALGNQPIAYRGDHIWFGTSHGRIYHSRNRGLNWEVHTAQPGLMLYSMAFQDSLTGLAVAPYFTGGFFNVPPTILKTIDGGQSWTDLQNSMLYYDLTHIRFVEGTDSSYIMTSTLGDGLAMYSTNEGESWHVFPDAAPFGAIDFASADEGWIARNLGAVDSISLMAYKYEGDVFTSASTGIKDYLRPLKSILLYPNPTRDYVQLELPQNLMNQSVSISIIDLSGRLVQHITKKAAESLEPISVSRLPQGMYHVIIESKGNRMRGHFIKN